MINPRTALMGILPVAILALGGLIAKALIDSYEETHAPSRWSSSRRSCA